MGFVQLADYSLIPKYADPDATEMDDHQARQFFLRSFHLPLTPLADPEYVAHDSALFFLGTWVERWTGAMKKFRRVFSGDLSAALSRCDQAGRRVCLMEFMAFEYTQQCPFGTVWLWL